MLQTKLKQKYQYNKKDLLENPERYSYTTFGGTDFLLNYFDDRSLYLERLEHIYLSSFTVNKKRISTIFIFKPLIQKYLYFFSDKIIAMNILQFENIKNHTPLFNNNINKTNDFLINTKKILLSLLLFKNQDKDIYYWLNIFTRKFEVTKKIRSFYTPELKKTKNSNYKSLINYALLAANLLIYFDKTKNYKMLNCALKLNDLLTSKIDELKKSPEILITLLSLQLEKNIIKKLLRTKSIKI
ncbi:MAG: hypothetical protein K940chlam1_01098 [Candidatus Anoxychlamydiales bacterium]|nr:hypothetical protein [Candidatus Anoxychlamydiales bacterium]NGX35211.1 hypothetical protein [Candidatus Anoxychlamydiales bacterium]